VICKAVYDNETEVPAAFKDDFTRRADGKWVMKDDAVPGAAELLNPGLAQNRDRALTQKTTAEEARRAAETRASELETQLNAAREPGGVILTKADAAVWARFLKLGDVKEVEKIVTVEFPRLDAAAKLSDRQKAWAGAVEALKPFGVTLNSEVLSDLMTHPQRGEGLEIELRPTEVDNGAGGRVTVNFPHVTKRVPVTGKENEFTVEAVPLLDYAQKEWPAWAFNALTTPPADPAGGGAAGGGQPGLIPLSTGGGGFGGAQTGAPAFGGQQPGAFRLPVVGQTAAGLKLPPMGAGASTAGGGAAGGGLLDGSKQAEQFNTARNTKPGPFTRPQQQQQQTGGAQTGGAQSQK
jgi:hypothetical protein